MKNAVKIGKRLTLLTLLICFFSFLISLQALAGSSLTFNNNIVEGTPATYQGNLAKDHSYEIRIAINFNKDSSSNYMNGTMYFSINSKLVQTYNFQAGQANGIKYQSRINHYFTTNARPNPSVYNITIVITKLSGGLSPAVIWVFQDGNFFHKMGDLIPFFLVGFVIFLAIELSVILIAFFNKDEFHDITLKTKAFLMFSPFIGMALMALIPIGFTVG